MSTDRDWMNGDAVQPFIWTVQALAMPATEQISLYPDFADVVDELVIDHDEARKPFLVAAEGLLSPAQRQAIDDLDQQFARMAGLERPELWEEEALHGAPEWICVRELAAIVLDQMGWAHEKPWRMQAIYIGPGTWQRPKP
jgi:hypothetical protein